MSGYHKLTGRYKIRTVKNWQTYFGGFSVREIWSNILSLLGSSATWPLLCIKYISGKVGKAFNTWQTVAKCPWNLWNRSFFFRKSRKFHEKMENSQKQNSLDSRQSLQLFSSLRSDKQANSPPFLGVLLARPKRGILEQAKSDFTH